MYIANPGHVVQALDQRDDIDDMTFGHKQFPIVTTRLASPQIWCTNAKRVDLLL